MNTKKFEFSKVILIIVSMINLVITLFACAIMWKTNDLSPLSYLIPSSAAEMATATGFYYSKAKVENRIKLMHSYGVEPTADAFNENT